MSYDYEPEMQVPPGHMIATIRFVATGQNTY
jgi:hypothetical protein